MTDPTDTLRDELARKICFTEANHCQDGQCYHRMKCMAEKLSTLKTADAVLSLLPPASVIEGLIDGSLVAVRSDVIKASANFAATGAIGAAAMLLADAYRAAKPPEGE